jgi:hypothetical protein
MTANLLHANQWVRVRNLMNRHWSKPTCRDDHND